MKDILEIYRHTFRYKWTAIAVILCNLGFVIFGLISMALFIPFLGLIFDEETVEVVLSPVYDGTVTGFFSYIGDWYNYQMYVMTDADPKGALLFVCVSVAISFFLKNIFRYGAIWFQSQLRMAVVRDLRDSIFDKAMRLPISYYTDEKRGDLMARMQSDVGEIENAVISVLELFFREPVAIIITLSVLLYWSASLTMFALLMLPVTALIIVVIGKSLKRTAKQGQEQMGVLYSAIDEGLGGIRIIKAFNAVGKVLASFKHENLKHQKLITKAFRKRDLASPLNETVGTLVMIAIVWYGGLLVLDSANSGLTGKVFMGFIIVFSQLMRPIQSVSQSMSNINKSRASLDRINEILNADEKIYEAQNPVAIKDLETAVSYKNISFKYREDYVLKNVSFEIPIGKTIALVGESGSGKSTIADLLPRFYEVEEGGVFFDDINIKDVSLYDLREQIGIVSQESILFNTTVRDNIAFGMPNATKEEIINAAKIANAHNFIAELENGYDTNIGERGNKLSGGQKQRLSIARAILKNPAILILDEATSALDTESEKLVQEALDNLMQNRTSLVIAHRLSTIKKADSIIVLSKGEIMEQGTHDELIELKGMYHKLSSLQGINE
ncbi:MAG: ABC transporter ATP-binding protein [Crocinitomicaceae bacterium]|nr:ABC transporter ATP-binding protein [Crocinitomicaceae bacterium]